MIEVAAVTKRFGPVTALDGVDLTVSAGSVLGLLGHNGAGKTTLVNILSTCLPPTTGTARVAGFDVVRQAHDVRRVIGVAGQVTAVDALLTGRENLRLTARLLGAGRREALARTDELLESFGLAEAAGRQVRTYSGGMRRRLDLAAALAGRPRVLFLDEPTTGLDPLSRLRLWDVVEGLARNGAAVLLTTQYLEEADRLADHIVVLSAGRTVASGTVAGLKAEVGRCAVTVRPAEHGDRDRALAALRRAGLEAAGSDSSLDLTLAVRSAAQIADVVRVLDSAGVTMAALTFSEPTLQDVYLSLTRHSQPDRSPEGARS